MARILATLTVIVLVLPGCSGIRKAVDDAGTYDARIVAYQNDEGKEVIEIRNKHGAALDVTTPRGYHVTATDPAHPESPSWFSNLMTLAGAKFIAQE